MKYATVSSRRGVGGRGRGLRIAIKCPAPRESDAKYWGDYHLAHSLGRALARCGCRVRVELMPQWYDGRSRNDDLIIVLRGLTNYRANREHFNFCWVISHPEQITDAELETYDHVYVASTRYAEQLRARLKVPVSALLQCSDPEIFYPPATDDDLPGADLLFAGNSRREMRKIVRDCIDQKLPLTVHGRQWESLIPSHFIKSTHIPNLELHRHYGKAKIVLNDHWPDMASHGFISNRIFDVALSGGFVISDQVTGSEIFDGAIVTYTDGPELARLCERWLGDDVGRRDAASRLRRLVLTAHTFDHRAAVIVNTVEKLRSANIDHPRKAEMKRLRAENRRARSWLRRPVDSAQRIQQVQAELNTVAEALKDQSLVMALARALVRLQAAFDRLLGSRRWRLGSQFGRGLDLALGRRKEKPVADYVREILAAFANWKDDVVTGRRSPSAASEDAAQLARWIEKLDHAFESTMRSRRWRFGNAIGRLYDLAPPRLREPFVTEEMRSIFLEVRRLRLDATIDRTIRDTAFGRTLARIAADAFPVALAERLAESEASLAAKTKEAQKVGSPPLVSIIMPTYNRAAVIGQAIQSVIEQNYPQWELLVCDDGSCDDTESAVKGFADSRIRYLKLPKRGGSAARNAGLKEASGSIFAYLDSDNIWHPAFLSAMISTFRDNPGRSAIYCDYIDFQIDKNGRHTILSVAAPAFNHERLLQKNFIDLNSFAHRRELYDCFGGFNERLTRRQDYDVILKYSWLRDPLHAPWLVTLYQRNEQLTQVTSALRADSSCVPIIEGSVAGYLRHGLPLADTPKRRKVTILSWDLSRNHFSKPFALAEALSKDRDVQLVAFRFFEDEIFPPLKDVAPSFETVYLPGARFPDFFEAMSDAVEAIRGDVIYAVKPRLPSLGLALLANQRRGVPVILESNDLETAVSNPHETAGYRTQTFDMADLADPELLTPYSGLWGQLMDSAARNLPFLVTHNAKIDAHFDHKCLYMRNVKDEVVYDPDLYDRERVRADLGFTPEDRVILFGGMLRQHKGIYELVELVSRLKDPRYKLLFVGSRSTPDQGWLMREHGNAVRLLPPQDPAAMARINLAADLVILWLDPDVPASHYQMPYKATDALAMRTPIIANDISDLGELGRQGYLKLVPFGDWDAMTAAVRNIFDNPRKTAARSEAGRRLFLRQFSYAAARGNFALMLHRVDAAGPGPLPVADRFAEWFERFRQSVVIRNVGKVSLSEYDEPAERMSE